MGMGQHDERRKAGHPLDPAVTGPPGWRGCPCASAILIAPQKREPGAYGKQPQTPSSNQNTSSLTSTSHVRVAFQVGSTVGAGRSTRQLAASTEFVTRSMDYILTTTPICRKSNANSNGPITMMNTSPAYENPDAFAKRLVRPRFDMNHVVKADFREDSIARYPR